MKIYIDRPYKKKTRYGLKRKQWFIFVIAGINILYMIFHAENFLYRIALQNQGIPCVMDIIVYMINTHISSPFFAVIYILTINYFVKDDFHALSVTKYSSRTHLWKAHLKKASVVTVLFLTNMILCEFLFMIMYTLPICNWQRLDSLSFYATDTLFTINMSLIYVTLHLIYALLCFGTVLMFLLFHWSFSNAILPYAVILIFFILEKYHLTGLFYGKAEIVYEHIMDHSVYFNIMYLVFFTGVLLFAGSYLCDKKEFYEQ